MILNHKRMGEGNPLIILHGLFGMLDNWQALANRFSENFEVILVDQRNHGRSPHHAVHTYEAMSDDLEELIHELDLEDPILLGHSMGGKTVMMFAQRFPEISSKIIVADIAPRAYEIHHDLIVKGLKSVPVGKLGKRTDAAPYLREYIGEEGVIQFLMKSLYWKEPKNLQFRFNLEALSASLSEIGEAIYRGPYNGSALFIDGEKSNYVSQEDREDIALYFPNASFKTIPNAGHWLHAEQPELFYQAIMEFAGDKD